MSDVEAAIQKQADREAAIARKEAEEARPPGSGGESQKRRGRPSGGRRESQKRSGRGRPPGKRKKKPTGTKCAVRRWRPSHRRQPLREILREYTQTDWNGDDQEAEEMPEQDYYEDDGDYEEPEEEVVESDEDDEEEMDIDEFAQYACKYASDIDCSITGKSMLALYERIEIMEEEGIPLTKRHAEDLIEEAADKAEKPSLGKRITNLFSSKYDKNGLLILKEEHFIE